MEQVVVLDALWHFTGRAKCRAILNGPVLVTVRPSARITRRHPIAAGTKRFALRVVRTITRNRFLFYYAERHGAKALSRGGRLAAKRRYGWHAGEMSAASGKDCPSQLPRTDFQASAAMRIGGERAEHVLLGEPLDGAGNRRFGRWAQRRPGP